MAATNKAETISNFGRKINECSSDIFCINHSAGTAQSARSIPQPRKLSTDSSNTVILQFTQYLRSRYQALMPTFFTLQWPPPPTRKTFNLAMIRGQNIPYGPIDEDMVRRIQQGKVKDILYHKIPVELKDILQMDSNKRKVVLIEGAAGSGKSTLAWHVCQTWGSGKLFQDFRSVVYVQLRDPAILSCKAVEDIIPAVSRNQAEMVMKEFRTCGGQDLLLVLDGWDELPSHLRAESIFQKLIAFPEALNLHRSTVVITSRPIASSYLYHHISSRIEILGFTPTEVKDYFTEALGGERQALKLQDQLNECPMVECSCYLPVNAAIISHLFMAHNYSLPTTLHEIFTLLVRGCLQRHVAKQVREEQRIISLDNLPLDLQKFFEDICTLAYYGVMDNRVIFSEEYLESRSLPKISETLGLIQGVESFTSLERSTSFYFLHRSVQELLASFYISKLPANKQLLEFNKLFGEPRYAAVFRFYAAFTKLETDEIRKIVADIVQKKENHQLLYLLHGIYEAHTPSLCQFVGSKMGGELNLNRATLSSVDCQTVGYFISCICLTTNGEFKASLQACSLDAYRVGFLTRELSKCIGSSSMHEANLTAAGAGVSSCLELTLE